MPTHSLGSPLDRRRRARPTSHTDTSPPMCALDTGPARPLLWLEQSSSQSPSGYPLPLHAPTRRGSSWQGRRHGNRPVRWDSGTGDTTASDKPVGLSWGAQIGQLQPSPLIQARSLASRARRQTDPPVHGYLRHQFGHLYRFPVGPDKSVAGDGQHIPQAMCLQPQAQFGGAVDCISNN